MRQWVRTFFAALTVAALTTSASACARPGTTAARPQLTSDRQAPNLGWPVRGQIITSLCGSPDGPADDGINIAVAEGAPIAAADSGIVAYAGNELKGYGNLIILSHPNGYVTAYAHASQLLVRRGDKVEKCQVIALAGQTGSVHSPQLHFELRKGSTPLDPIPLLVGCRKPVGARPFALP